MLWVDTRWAGHHGIARYGREVTRRLSVEHAELDARTHPLSVADIALPARMRLSRRDVVYSPGFNAGLARATQILTVHDLIHLEVDRESSVAKRAYLQTLVRPAIRRAGMVVTVSPRSADVIARWTGLSREHVVDAGNGVSPDFHPGVLPEAGVGDAIVYVGNGKPHKNPEPLFAALRLRPGLRLIVVASDHAWARSLGHRLGVPDRIEMRAGMDDRALARLYRGARGVVMPSLVEGFGLPVAEALASGGRVAYWSGCEALVDAALGYGVKATSATDAEAWAHVTDLLGDGAGGGDPAEVVETYRWESVAQRVDQALARVLESAGQR